MTTTSKKQKIMLEEECSMNNKERYEQIKNSLEGLGTNPEQKYTHKEIIDRLIALENALLAGVYEKNHAENMRPQDLTKHFATLAEEFGLDNSDIYQRFLKNMYELDRTVKGLIAGQKGEHLTRSYLRPLTYDPNVKILYNIALENEGMKTEYDAIVIAPYGLFVVEVKNWSGDVTLTHDGFLTRNGRSSTNLAACMLVKETLLRNCLGEMFPTYYHSVLLIPENKTRLKDEYHQISIAYGASIANSIRFCSGTRVEMSPRRVDAIAKRLCFNSVEQLSPCPVRCDVIIDDFAMLMAQMEAASNEEVEQDDDGTIEVTVTANIEMSPNSGEVLSHKLDNLSNVDWKRIGKITAGITAVLFTGFVAGCAIGGKCKKFYKTGE